MKGIVGVEELEGGSLRVTGLGEGVCSLKLMGDGSMEETYEIDVGSDLAQIQRNLQAELEDVGGIEVVRIGRSLVLRGEINDPRGWQLLKTTVKGAEYREIVRDQTVFRVQADTLKDFRQQLKDAGFVITDKVDDASAGKLFVKYEGNLLIVAGVVHSPGEKDRLERIVRSQGTWLRIEGASSSGQEDWKTVCRMDISVDNSQLRMDVVLIGYAETDVSKYGSSDTLQLGGVFQGLIDLYSGRTRHDNFTVNASLNSTLGFLKENGIARHSIGGHIFFKNNDPEVRKLKIGGTLKVKMQGATAEGAPTQDFEDIEYGFFIDKKRAVLIDGKSVDVDLTIKQKTPEAMPGGYEEGYEIHENEYNPSVVCPLGKTVVLAGYRSMLEESSPPSGFPILRHIPIVNWFVSQEGNRIENMKLMMLVSVRIAAGDEPEAQQAVLPYEDTKNLPAEVEIPNDRRLEGRRKWHGIMYFMNWFTP
ncbi:MAG: hypothetical protein ACI4RD_08305 [Kiritimatiellia bacterium]